MSRLPTAAEVSSLYGVARANCATVHQADRMSLGDASDYWQHWDRIRYACETWLRIRHPRGEEATEMRRLVIRLAVGLDGVGAS